jgi:hypothetical protein
VPAALPPNDPDDPWLPLGAASRLVGVGPRHPPALGRHRQGAELPDARRPSPLPSIEPRGDDQRPAPPSVRDGAPAGLDADDGRRSPPARSAHRLRGQPWQARLSAEQRDEFRRWGQRTFQLVIEYVAASKKAERQLLLEEAEKMGGLYGSEASQAGLSLAETVEAFLFFRSPVLDAITGHLRRRAADVADVTTAFHEANAAIDQVLMALVSSHRESR